MYKTQLYGTVKLLEADEQARIRGLIINKFRGDVEILRPGLSQLEDLTGKPDVYKRQARACASARARARSRRWR